MATTTPNYGWPVPTSTDYVKDGATAIEALGDAIDATVFGLPSAGLTLISATTVGSAVASVTVSSAFSSTYDNYKIIWTGGASSGSNDDVKMTLGATTTGYYSIRSGIRYAGTAFNFVDANNGTYWLPTGTVGTVTNLNMDILHPNAAAITLFNSSWQSGTGIAFSAGYQNSSTQFTAFTLTPNTGTFTGGIIRVYGYKNS
jgi:hypothetical protein